MKYKTCPYCGDNLDHGERCTCLDEKRDAPAATGTSQNGNDGDRCSVLSISDPYLDVKNLLRLREILEETGAMAKDVALVVREEFPKFNRQLLSQCGNCTEYGVIPHPNVLRRICTAYNLKLTVTPDIPITVENENQPPKKAENRTLDRKLTFRVTNGIFEIIQKRAQDEGYNSVQSCLFDVVVAWLGLKSADDGGIDDEHS